RLRGTFSLHRGLARIVSLLGVYRSPAGAGLAVTEADGLAPFLIELPSGATPFPAVAMVHGAGPRTRDEFDVFTAYLALHGVAVLADDKRGVGESTGLYPGDEASEANIDLLAHDAQREVRFLAALPQIDKRRIGLFGDSQAGWISPLAASRDPAIR